MPGKILDRIDDDLRTRTLTLGGFRPDKLSETELLKQLLIESLPKPIGKRDVVAIKEMHFDLVAVDISASMKNPLDEGRVQKTLEMLIYSSPLAKLLAIDTAVKKEWARAETGFQELFGLSRNGGTDLPKALSTYDLERSIVVTDNDGWEQLSNMVNPPYLVIEVGTEKTLYFHFRG